LDSRDGAARVGEDDLFYERHLAPLESRMLRTAWRITRDSERARDALQDAMARIWAHRDRVRTHPNPEALVLRIVIGAAVDALRRETRRRQVEGSAWRAVWSARLPGSPAREAEATEVRALVLDALARLPAKQSAAVALRVLEEQPYEAIAAALGCAEATARVHVLRGRAKLARLLRELTPVDLAERSGR
jgi:RNA polymerase sigma factor (sigma-70 family)